MKLIPNAVTRSIATSILRTKKNSPHIFFAGGVIGIIGSTVLACRSTLKLEEVVDEANTNIGTVKELHKSGTVDDETDYYKSLGLVYAKSAIQVGKLYAPALVLGTASVAALTGSHVAMTRRNAALTATAGLIAKAYDDYRDRVRRELGEEHELEIYHAVDSKVIAQRDGIREVVKISDPNRWSMYARFFDESCSAWEKNAEINRIYVQSQQNYFNHRLQAYGHVFLNEVYDAFGMERSQPGAVVGWVISDDGDNYIDFGMFEAYNRDFVNGQERSILLDFNVDGVIYDKI